MRSETGWSTTLGVIMAILAVGLLGCGNITDVSEPDLTQPGDLNNPPGALARRAGAIRDFSIAFADQVFYSGLVADEFTTVDGSSSDDLRILGVTTEQFPYNELSEARIGLLRAIIGLKQYDPTPKWHIAELYAYVGLAEVLLSEDMCSGVPLANVTNDTPALGPTLTRSQLLQRAVVDLDSAATYAVDSGSTGDSVRYLVAVAKGRALLDSGDFADAGAAINAAAIPVGFVYQPPYDGNIQINTVTQQTVDNMQSSVSDREGLNGLNFRSALDPRVPINNLGATSAGPDTVYGFAPYSTDASPINIASGPEAQLILAEAALQNGDVNNWAAALNDLRANAISPPIAPLLADSTTNASASDQVSIMFRERGFWLFGTGHRHSDLRRLVRQYHRAVDAVFPTGLYHSGPQQYGSDVTFVPSGESNNPQFTACFDRNS